MTSDHTGRSATPEVLTDQEIEDSFQAMNDFRARLVATPGGAEALERARHALEMQNRSLRQLRKAQRLTQAALAELLEIDQSKVSRIEHQSDMLLSTLRRFVEATGGDLRLIAQYPDAQPFEIRLSSDTANQLAG